jgi:4-hydroxy-4-methyl-2-oxoglutarate aldolase
MNPLLSGSSVHSPEPEIEVVSVHRALRNVASREELLELTAAWVGPRFDSGRPRVPDEILAGLRTATIEQAWGILREAGYHRQFVGGWHQTNPGRILVGRAVTSQFLPHRPDFDAVVVATGAHEGNTAADRQNSWIIDTLEAGDVMVTDIFGKVVDGTVIGDNLGTAVATRTGVGAVIDGGVRDAIGLQALSEVNFFHRGADPTAIQDVTLAGINRPIRIGAATVLPGDVVLGTTTGVIFIPAVLAAAVAETSVDITVRDVFGKQRLSERRYSSAQIDVSVWADDIEADFQSWRSER